MSNGFRKPREVASLVKHGQAVSPDEIYHAIMFPQKEIERLEQENDKLKNIIFNCVNKNGCIVDLGDDEPLEIPGKVYVRGKGKIKDGDSE